MSKFGMLNYILKLFGNKPQLGRMPSSEVAHFSLFTDSPSPWANWITIHLHAKPWLLSQKRNQEAKPNYSPSVNNWAAVEVAQTKSTV